MTEILEKIIIGLIVLFLKESKRIKIIINYFKDLKLRKNKNNRFVLFMSKKGLINIGGFMKEKTLNEILGRFGQLLYFVGVAFAISIFSISYFIKYSNIWNHANMIVLLISITFYVILSAIMMPRDKSYLAMIFKERT